MILAAQSYARSTVQRLVGATDADDVLQQAAFKAWLTRDTFRNDCSYNVWFYRIAVNAALMHLRARRTDRSDSVENLDAFTSCSESQHERYERLARAEKLYAAVELLPLSLQRAVQRMLREEKTTGAADKAARFRARKKLRELLTERR